MPVMVGLVENECLKILRRKRIRLVMVVLAALLCLVVFAQNRQQQNQRKEHPERDWKAQVEKRASDLERQMTQRRGIPEQWKRWMKYESGRLRYYLSKNLNPNELTGPVFTRTFAGVGSVLLIPLLIAVFGADLVSSEFAEKTVTLLLTRPVARWKVLLSKLIAMVLFTTLTLLAAFVLSWGISGVAFGWRGWGAPMLTGFRLGSGPGAAFDLTGVKILPLWQDALAAWGLAWLSALAVGAVTLLLSVLFRSAAAAMGTMMATLVAGTILSRIASDWDGAKWFFVTNLPLPEFYAGMPAPFDGMTLAFSTYVLAGWAVAATAVAFFVFTRRDVTA
jgi:ABC-2 type transport system permease protein